MERQKIVHNKILDYAYSQELCLYKDPQTAVYRGHHIPTSEPVLVKIVDIKGKKQEELSQYIGSLKSLKALEHENLSRLLDIINTPANMFIMYEYHEINLQQIIAQGKVTEEESVQLLEQIVSAIHYLHSRNIAHKNICSSSMMIKQGKGGGLKIKVSHPSQSEEMHPKHRDSFSTPESLFKKGGGMKGDIWSLGVVYFQLLNGDGQAKLMDPEQFQSFVTSPNTYKVIGVSNWSKSVLLKMLVVEPEKRADINEILQMLKMKGHSSILGYQPLPQHHSSEPKLELPTPDLKPSTGIIPTSPRQKDNHQYHRSPLKYINKSPIRRNQSIDTISKSPMHRPVPAEINMEAKQRISLYIQMAVSVQKLLFIFNEAKVIYQQAVRITLLTLRHFSEIVRELQKLIQKHKSIVSDQQLRVLRACQQKVLHYEQNNQKRMQHDTYFTHLLSTSKESDPQFLTYIQFWLRLAIRHSIDFVDVNRYNLIQKRYLESIYWSYLHTLKYYVMLDWLKGERKGSKIPESLVDKIMGQRQEISIDSFKSTQELAMKFLRI